MHRFLRSEPLNVLKALIGSVQTIAPDSLDRGSMLLTLCSGQQPLPRAGRIRCEDSRGQSERPLEHWTFRVPGGDCLGPPRRCRGGHPREDDYTAGCSHGCV